MSVSKDLVDIIKGSDDKGTKAYDTSATVTRVEGSTAWVHIPGGVDETPVKKTINAKAGDVVQVRVSGGSAWLNGNASAPPTDDTTAVQANETATVAAMAADSAVQYANDAQKSAASAQASATTAYNAATAAQTSATNAYNAAVQSSEYASRALGNLSTVQSVAETLTWITQHGTMALTTDVALDPTHVYFVVDAGGDYTVGGVTYAIVTEPDVDDIGTYYELTIDESLNNYVGTHLALTSEGLWLLPASSGTNKVLIATGAGSVYTTAGTYILDSSGGTVASFRANGVTIGEVLNGQTRTEIGTSGMQIVQRVSGSDTQIAHLAYGPGVASGGGTANAPYYTLGKRSSSYSVGNWSVAEGDNTAASKFASHAEGSYTVASNERAHAEGYNTEASGNSSHAEGTDSVASATASHAEGWSSTASGDGSHAEGEYTTASGDYSHSQNYATIAQRKSQTALGEYNVADTAGANGTVRGTYALIVGNGTADNARSNAFTVDWSGNVNIASGAKYKINGTNLSASDVGAVSTSEVTSNGESNKIPIIKSDGVFELRKYIDLHDTSSSQDYDVRIRCGSTTGVDGGAALEFTCGSFKINSNTVADFVTEQGTSSSWYYRKWKSGKVEAWRTYSPGSQTPSQWVTGWYYKDFDITIGSGIFSSTPTHVVATNTGSDYQFMVFSAVPTSSTNIRVRVVKPNSGGATPNISVYVSNMV